MVECDPVIVRVTPNSGPVVELLAHGSQHAKHVAQRVIDEGVWIAVQGVRVQVVAPGVGLSITYHKDPPCPTTGAGSVGSETVEGSNG